MNTILENRHGTVPYSPRNTQAMSRQSTHKSGRQTWMVSFADLMAILLTFMVVSFSTREINEVPWQHMNHSMLEAFKSSAVSDQPAFESGAIGSVASAASDEVIAELITDRFPEQGSAGSIRATSSGVEVDVTQNAGKTDTAGSMIRYLATLDREILVKVEASLPGQNRGTVQRTLAWERGLTVALELQSRLAEQGLSSQPDIQVTMAPGSGRTTLVVKSARRAAR